MSEDAFVTQIWEAVYGRSIRPDELAAATSFLADFRTTAGNKAIAVAKESPASTVDAGSASQPGVPGAASTGTVDDETIENGVLVTSAPEPVEDTQLAARAALVQAVFASAEFRYVR